ncbi:hypothetical protein [Chelatococcus reniformis]|uniref:Uncharacterized protein n=1 Tax=Chelatococcus reniformis TaxID=1494448 RepID=A0A916UCZ1_9HYPH|nr:hypothetical protein [Chelatococcus reniformis]GGC68897.1 hypothetical protein GCM10010994_29330 [Chelatococcus reniformis]
MSTITYFIVLSFVRDADDALIAEQPIEMPSASLAEATAERMACVKAGAVALSRTGDPAAGAFGEAVILARFGEVPDDLDEFT